VTNQEGEVDEDEEDFDAHGPGALAVSRRTFLTTQFNNSLTSRLHSERASDNSVTALHCVVTAACTTCHLSRPKQPHVNSQIT